MPVTAIRLQNFMGLEDTDWIELRPITTLFGKNSSGKSAIVRALLLLKQSLDVPQEAVPLVFKSKDGVDLGSFHRMIRGRTVTEKLIPFEYPPDTLLPRYMTFGFRCDVQANWLEKVFGESLSPEEQLELSFAEVSFSYQCTQKAEKEDVELAALSIKVRATRDSDDRKTLFETIAVMDAQGNHTGWHDSRSDFLSDEELPPSSVVPEIKDGFIPHLKFELLQTNEEVPQRSHAVIGIIKGCADEIRGFLKAVQHIGPIRSKPRRYYFPESVIGAWERQEGLDVILDFLNCDDDRKDKLVGYWMKRLGLGERISKRRIDLDPDNSEFGYEVQVEKEGETPLVSLTEVGYGTPMVLPIVLKALFAPTRSVVLVEQPELHLHPAAQAALADLFISQAQAEHRFLIETHSEHLLLRMERRIAETTLDRMCPDKDGKPSNEGYLISEKSFGLTYINPENESRPVQYILANRYGILIEPSEEFQDFFKYDYEEVVHLNQAIARIKKLELENGNQSHHD